MGLRPPCTWGLALAIGLHERGKVAPNFPRELSYRTLSDVEPRFFFLSPHDRLLRMRHYRLRAAIRA